MSRVIKFRVWDTYLKMMFNWEEVKNSGYELDSVFELISAKAMQFTGVKDRNGVEVYEGDIINVYNDDYHENTQHTVEWGGDEYPAFTVTEANLISEESNAFSYLIANGINFEVVGNIFENELPVGSLFK